MREIIILINLTLIVKLVYKIFKCKKQIQILKKNKNILNKQKSNREMLLERIIKKCNQAFETNQCMNPVYLHEIKDISEQYKTLDVDGKSEA